jgi:radical SAM protein with 4Fe4S-binding SPASM domain
MGVNLIWYSPTPYCEFNPINNGLGIKQCTACSINMAIEPDGTVLPCQSCYEPLGNIFRTPWRRIWDHKLCKRIRERRYVPERCRDCELLDVCGGGCPLSEEHGDYLCTDRSSNM